MLSWLTKKQGKYTHEPLSIYSEGSIVAMCMSSMATLCQFHRLTPEPEPIEYLESIEQSSRAPERDKHKTRCSRAVPVKVRSIRTPVDC